MSNANKRDYPKRSWTIDALLQISRSEEYQRWCCDMGYPSHNLRILLDYLSSLSTDTQEECTHDKPASDGTKCRIHYDGYDLCLHCQKKIPMSSPTADGINREVPEPKVDLVKEYADKGGKEYQLLP